MATSQTVTNLIHAVQESQGTDVWKAYAFACGMLGYEVPEETVLEMIESLTRKAN